MKKRVKSLIALLLAMVLVAGCGSSEMESVEQSTSSKGGETDIETNVSESNEGNEQENSSQETPVTLRISWWGSQTRHDYTLELLDMYTELNPHITFEPEYSGWGDYWTKLSYQAAANELPDIMQMGIGWAESDSLVKAGMFADLSKYEDSDLNLSGISESLLSTGYVDEKLYGVPISFNALSFIYDPDILESAGVEVPEYGYTWDDYYEICKKIEESLGIYGTGEIGTPSILIDYYPRQFGETFYVETGNNIGISPSVMQDYFEMKLKFQKENLMPDLTAIGQQMGAEDVPLVHGDAGFALQWVQMLPVFEAAAGKSLEILTLPGPNPSDAAFVNPGMFFSVAETSEAKEESAKFINWLLNDVEANLVINSERGVPASEFVRDGIANTLGKSQQKVFDYVDFVSENSTPKSTFLPENANEITQLIKEIEEQILFEVITPEEGVEQFFNSLE